jgi:hypothetical protein
VSDDNGSSSQVMRIVALAVPTRDLVETTMTKMGNAE